jgi:hypothetical protein
MLPWRLMRCWRSLACCECGRCSDLFHGLKITFRQYPRRAPVCLPIMPIRTIILCDVVVPSVKMRRRNLCVFDGRFPAREQSWWVIGLLFGQGTQT